MHSIFKRQITTGSFIQKLFENSTRQFTRHAVTNICSPEKIMSVNPQQN